MESSEDDAGTATNASRRESAREKEVGRLEDVDATSSFQQDTFEHRTSCQTPAMSEDNFDGDSVPSPSTHDVNTSTEAILDMIDEIVDGPGAPKRLPLLLDTDARSLSTSYEHLSNSQGLEPSVQHHESESAVCSVSEVHKPVIENTKSDTICAPTIQNEAVCVKLEYSDNNQSSHHDYVNINCELNQNVDSSANSNSEPISGVSTDICESSGINKTDLSVISKINKVSNSNVEQMICVSTVDNQSEMSSENVDISTSDSVSVQPAFSELSLIRSSEIESIGNNVCLHLNIEEPVSIQEHESVSCASSNNVKSGFNKQLQTQAHCLMKDIPKTDFLLDSSVNSTDDRQSSQIESEESHSECKQSLISESSDCELSKNVECSSYHESSELNIVPISESYICDYSKSHHIESSNNETIKFENTQGLDNSTRPNSESASTSNVDFLMKSNETSDNECLPAMQTLESAEITQNISAEPTHSIASIGIAVDSSLSKPSPSLLSIEDTIKTVVDTTQQASNSGTLSNDPLPNIPSSSVSKTEQNVQISEKEANDRTRCVTSSEKRDKVIIESAESTSYDSSVSEAKSCSVESTARTPLRRRLMRPALTRPDSTVSSTVDSSISPHIPEHLSECMKDVSSSSDAVSTVHEDKSDEIRSVNEISICKAETSTSPAKKIRLVRRKNEPQINNTVFDRQGIIRESEQCESTSSSEEKSTVSEQVAQSCAIFFSQDNKIEENKTSRDIAESRTYLPEILNNSPRPSSSFNEPEESRDQNKSLVKILPLKLHIPSENKSFDNMEFQDKSNNEICYSNYDKELKDERHNELERTVPKLTIKVNNTPCDKTDLKSPKPKLTIKPLKAPASEGNDRNSEDKILITNITKLNIKPILKPPEKINEIHRKSSSSEISESEYSENDDSASTSDPASASEQGLVDIVPKVTIKLGKPGTETEGKFYTEPNIPKLTIKGISNEEGRESPSKLKIVICQSEEKQMEKIPKLTIKSVPITESQPLSPKLTIKSLKPPDGPNRDITSEDNPPIPKLIISTDSSNTDLKESHVPKITIKPITKPDDGYGKVPKKTSENFEIIPVITKLNIKPVLKPDNILEVCDKINESVPIVSKINIKPIIKPNDVNFCKDDSIPKITKLNIKPIKSPDGNSSNDTDCGELETNESKPIITKLNIKPIIKPEEEDTFKESENHSSGHSSDDNNDNIPVVTKINIKPIYKPSEIEHSEHCNILKDDSIPIVPKLIIKPLMKSDQPSALSPKKERTSSPDLRNQNIPVVTKLNIKPILKPEEAQSKLEDCDSACVKNPPLLMKINRTSRTDSGSDTQYHIDKSIEQYNNLHDNTPVLSKLTIKPTFNFETQSASNAHESLERSNFMQKNSGPEKTDLESNSSPDKKTPYHVSEVNQQNMQLNHKEASIENKLGEEISTGSTTSRGRLNEQNLEIIGSQEKTNTIFNYHVSDILLTEEEKQSNIRLKSQPSNTNCTLLKKLLENRKYDSSSQACDNSPNTLNYISHIQAVDTLSNVHETIDLCHDKNPCGEQNESSSPRLKICSMQDLCKVNESVTKPLEISISDKINQSSDQDSPRIILKINKTDQGASSKIITDEIINKNEHKSVNTNVESMMNRRRPILFGRKKQESETGNISEGKRLRSSRVVQSPEKSPFAKRNPGKRASNSDCSTTPPSPKEAELSVLDSKRLKFGQLLSSKTLTITPVVVSKASQMSPTDSLEMKQAKINHSLLNNENCSKNGSSKLHNILSNLQAKQQLKVIPLNDVHSERKHSESPDLKSCGTSLDSNPNIQGEIEPVHKNCADIRETIFQDSIESRDFFVTPDPLSQDPLEVGTLKSSPDITTENAQKIPTIVEMTPQPKKRGRPRKLPVSEGAKPLVLPTPALEERPQRSLRLSRDRPVILVKPRGRGRGRGRRIEPQSAPPQEPNLVETANKFFDDDKQEEIDPTSSRIKLPRMTEALDKMPSTCATPLTGRRRTSSSCTSEMPFFNTETPELKVVLETSLPRMEDPFAKSPEILGRGGRGGRGRGRGRATPRTPRGRGRGRGGGRGAMYMKETMGIYGRVCGPATTTVQLFEEETCMMDDNATPAKPSHLLDEDSQSSVKSSTNESSKTKKSKFADLFDSNKVWSASDVKEYTWPPPEKTAASEHQVMMIQEQVAMFLGVKSFKRRYPELKRRAISAEERAYVLSKGIVTEALCDLGITAVDASEVLDIMLSDYPHKYDEYRSYQREKQLSDPTPEPNEIKEAKEMKEARIDPKSSDKPEPLKVDPEKTRLNMAAAAIASASEWNTRVNALRRPACVDLQSLTIQRRRGPIQQNPPIKVTPPHGFYPHALLPGQYQHTYRVYSSEHLRYFPLNTVMAAPPAPPSPHVSSSESEGEWGSHASSSDSEDTHRLHKRKKLTKVKRSSETDTGPSSGPARVEEPEVDTCRTCKLRLEANRKTTHERFLVCATCNAKLHPGCVDLPPDTIRKCREYPWQCAECKICCSCSRPADGDKMLFCDLCDRGHHIYCVGLQRVPDGRWHCAECAVCKSCGARSPSGPPAPGTEASSSAGPQGSVTQPGGPHWHHQTRRGPGGHKVYSHSLCTPCARAYRIGRYCPLCERSFIGPKGTMQLVICKLCDRQLHQDCVKQTVSSLNVLDYTCGDCRRGGITSRAAAVRLAPRTIATLFMAKRRFNKYAHRQFMQKCKGQNKDDSDETGDPLPDDGD